MLSSNERREVWGIRRDGRQHSFDVLVTYGKDIDIRSIKAQSGSAYDIQIGRKVRDVFDSIGDFERTATCPVCDTGIDQARPDARMWRATYHVCTVCSHAYTDLVPGPRALDQYYGGDALHSDFYIRPEEIELRIKEIYAPKVAWAVRQYERIYGRKPESYLDFGTGGGHVLETARRMGMTVAGLEINRAHQEWCRKTFGITLTGTVEELRSTGRKFDLISSYNVIEHIPKPATFLSSYAEFSSPQSLSIMETPRYNSLGCWLERYFPERIKGILVPYKHVHLFTDASLATLLFLNGFRPASMWYFGQDAGDILFQIASEVTDNPDPLIFDHFEKLQKGIDSLNCSNLMIFAAIPPASTGNRSRT